MFSVVYKKVGCPAEVLNYEGNPGIEEIARKVPNPELQLIPINGKIYTIYTDEDAFDDNTIPFNVVWPSKYCPQSVRGDFMLLAPKHYENVSLTGEEIGECLAFCRDADARNPSNLDLVRWLEDIFKEEV